MDKKRLDKFLKELTKLTKKYNYSIGGCGCCGSPFITDLIDDDIYGEHADELTYENGKYTVKIAPPYPLPKINPKALINLGR